jgi:hypothetical protein
MTAPRILAITSCALLAACGGAFIESPGDAGAAPSTSYHIESGNTGSVTALYTISFAPNSYVIGNAYPRWTDEIEGATVFAAGPGNEGGANYQLGFLYGESFDHCGWLDRTVISGATASSAGPACDGVSSTYDDAIFYATYTHDGHAEGGTSDGATAYMDYDAPGCGDHNGYGNVAPWRVPATPDNLVGEIPDRRVLLRRYVSKDGGWVLVHDPAHDGSPTLPNWYFVRDACATPGAPPSTQPTQPGSAGGSSSGSSSSGS